MKLPGFIGPSYTLNSVRADCQALKNMYPEMDESGQGNRGEVASLVQRPGLRLYKTVGVGPGRGGINCNSVGRVFIVSGSELYEGQDTADPILRGSLVTASGPISMAENGLQLIIVDGPKGYIFTFADNTFVQITDDGFTGGTKTFFVDGYFFVNEPNTQKFFISDLYDGLSWNGLDFGSAEGLPDNIISMTAQGREAIFIGDTSTEFWANTGDASFPFTRLQGAFIEHGIEAADTLQNFDNAIIWLGRDKDGYRMVWRAAGYQAVRVSTHAVEQALQSYGDVSNATSFVFQMNGHSFYVLNFPSANTTWVYDAATQLWHEWTYTNDKGQQERHPANYHIFVGATHYVGDYRNGNVYELTNEVGDDNSLPITLTRTTAHISNDEKYMFFGSLTLVLDALANSGTHADLILDWSDDGGNTWSQPRNMSIGVIGAYAMRYMFLRLGKSRDRVWRVRIVGAKKTRLIAASVRGGTGN